MNKCDSCKGRCLDFIWTTSRYVNPAIRSMYPNQKICKKCYDEMCYTYPPVENHNHPPTQCPLCSGVSIYKERICDLDDDKKGNIEYVCQDCGCVLEEEEL